MIIKVRVPLEEEGVNQSWEYYAGVEGLQVIQYKDGVKQRAACAKLGIPAEVQVAWYEEPKPSASPLLFATFHSQFTGPMHLYCDTECYLLNDSGKTIERIF
jgi:hypothetical protein